MGEPVIRYALYIDLEHTGKWSTISNSEERAETLGHCHKFWKKMCTDCHGVVNSITARGDDFICFFETRIDIINASTMIVERINDKLFKLNPNSQLLIRPRISLHMIDLCMENDDYQTARA